MIFRKKVLVIEQLEFVISYRKYPIFCFPEIYFVNFVEYKIASTWRNRLRLSLFGLYT